MDYLPLFVDVKGASCLVIGGGEVARRKIELLLRAGAAVEVVALSLADGTRALIDDHGITVHERAYRPQDVRGRMLVVAATNDARVNEQIFDLCRSAGQLVNAVDHPEISNSIFPALIDRSPVVVAVSTGGSSPTLARTVRGWIEARLPPRLGTLADFLKAHRPIVKDRFSTVQDRQRFWERVISGPAAERVLMGNDAAAEDAFVSLLSDSSADPLEGSPKDSEAGSETNTGWVALVGAGPGDPELITLKGLRLLQNADVVLYDNLANHRLLDYARRDAEKTYVGKKRKFPGIRQAGINALLLEHARAGRSVVRLKGGDPFIFGRGGEEIETLAEEGIACIVVPGITAAIGSASYAGIPLTHRDVSQSVRFVTGHRASDRTNLDWPELAKPGQTLVIYMGLPGLEDIMAKLIEHGLPTTTPAALVEKATLPEQQVVTGTVADLAGKVRAAEITGPTTIIVGEVVGHRQIAE